MSDDPVRPGMAWQPLMFARRDTALPLATTAEIQQTPKGPVLIVHYEIANGSIQLPFDIPHAKQHVKMLLEGIAEAEKIAGKLTLARTLPPDIPPAPGEQNGDKRRGQGWGN